MQPESDKRRPAKRPRGFALLLLLAVVISLSACFYGSPDGESGAMPENMVGPNDSGRLVSYDGNVVIEFEKGTFASPVKLTIDQIDSANFPDQPFLVGRVYQFNPPIVLQKDVTIIVDLENLEHGHFVLSDLYNQNALTLREVVSSGKPQYVPNVQEQAIATSSGANHQSLIFQTNRLGAYGVFIHECYLFCKKATYCDTNDGEQSQAAVAACMDSFGCAASAEAANSEENIRLYECSQSHPCRASSGCCLTDACADVLPDGDEDAIDEEPAIDGDIDEVEEEQEQEGEGDDETSGGFFCDSDADCQSPKRCAKDLRTGLARGVCLLISDDVVQMNNKTEGGWESLEGEPQLQCVGQPPETGTDGPLKTNLRVIVDGWWRTSDLEGINVSLFYAMNLANSAANGVTNAAGEVLFEDVATEQHLVVFSKRTAETAEENYLPTYDWNLFISKEDAANAADGEIRFVIHPITEATLSSFAGVLGLSNQIDNGKGIVIGQVLDCGQNENALSNATVSLGETPLEKLGYFSGQLNAIPSPTERFTSKDGLFIAFGVEPNNFADEQDRLKVFTFGMLSASDEPELLGVSYENDFAVKAGSVSIIRFNHFR